MENKARTRGRERHWLVTRVIKFGMACELLANLRRVFEDFILLHELSYRSLLIRSLLTNLGSESL